MSRQLVVCRCGWVAPTGGAGPIVALLAHHAQEHTVVREVRWVPVEPPSGRRAG